MAVFDQISHGGALAGPEHHDRLDGFAPARIRNADHGGLLHRRVAVQRILHFGGIDVLATGNDHVLSAVHNSHVALLVHCG